MKAVEVEHLFKSYSGKVAVHDLSFAVSSGEVLGLIGPNGAGKSTTLKTILGFLRADSGKIAVFGGGLDDAAKNRIGYLPEERGLYKKLSAMELIVYLATLKGMGKREAVQRADRLLKRMGLQDSRKQKIEAMSKGMSQIVQLIVTVVHDPKLVILDEPFAGLDPVNTERLGRLIDDLRNRGASIILSTHQMHHVEELADRILMIHQGRAVLSGGLSEIKAKHRGNSVLVQTDGDVGTLNGVTGVRPGKDHVELTLDRDTDPQQVLAQLLQQGETIRRFEVATPSLHQIFLGIVGDPDA
jgi:ABC-2 type transport system ATP-binding protein